ncbi:MAG: PLAT/LH2 domain-containing protein [Chryseolinea sp.]
MKANSFINLLIALISSLLVGVDVARGQIISNVIVEIKTGDKRFAGTDDAVHFFIGGKDFSLDNPNKDDFERNNTDLFQLQVDDPEFTIELIRAIGRIGVIKTGDSYFGGGWYFQGIKIWLNDQSASPIYVNGSINKWMDGDHREWYTDLGDEGWNLPEPPPFPPCTVEDPIIIFFKPDGTNADSSKADTSVSKNAPSAKKGKPDADCDGIPDDSDPTFDPDQPDDDGDGLPNSYEDQNGLDPHSNDSDSDGWLDNRNVKDLLILTKVQCIDEDGRLEIGSDEIYLVSEDVRFPLSPSLDNYWEMDDDTKVEPFLTIDSRVTGNAAAIPQYKTRIKLREADFTFLEKPFDDDVASFTLDWTRNDTKEFEINEDGKHYKLFFKSITVNFMDPSGNSSIADFDGDGLSDELEFKISAQDATLRPSAFSATMGYNGLANPFRKELFIEVDATSSDDNLQFDAKQQIASQFYYHNIATRIDDGYLKGGEILPYKEVVSFNTMKSDYFVNHLWNERKSHFRYVLFVPSMGGQSNGRADRPGKRIIVSRSTMIGSFSSIVFIHEWGHTLGLSHPIGTKEPPSPYPNCPTPPEWNKDFDLRCIPPVDTKRDSVHCALTYCGVGDNDVTAMGDDIGIQDLVIGGLTGIFVGLAIIALFIPGIGWVAGAALLAAAAILGTLGGFLFSDPYQRVVDYHVNEWAALFFNVFV